MLTGSRCVSSQHSPCWHGSPIGCIGFSQSSHAQASFPGHVSSFVWHRWSSVGSAESSPFTHSYVSTYTVGLIFFFLPSAPTTVRCPLGLPCPLSPPSHRRHPHDSRRILPQNRCRSASSVTQTGNDSPASAIPLSTIPLSSATIPAAGGMIRSGRSGVDQIHSRRVYRGTARSSWTREPSQTTKCPFGSAWPPNDSDDRVPNVVSLAQRRVSGSSAASVPKIQKSIRLRKS